MCNGFSKFILVLLKIPKYSENKHFFCMLWFVKQLIYPLLNINVLERPLKSMPLKLLGSVCTEAHMYAPVVLILLEKVNLAKIIYMRIFNNRNIIFNLNRFSVFDYF